METTEIIALAAGILAVVVAGLAYYRSGRPFTVQGVTETLEASQPLADQIRDVAEVVVNGIEQLKETGKIQTNEDAFKEAMDHLHGWFPDVEPERLIPFIEAAYRGVKFGSQLMKRDLAAAQPLTDGQRLASWADQELRGNVTPPSGLGA